MEKTVYPVKPVVLVDDEEEFLRTASFLLKSEGITNIVKFSDSTQVMDFLKDTPVCVCVLDMMMPNVSGTVLLQKIIENFSNIPVIMVTAVNEVDTAVDCMKMGAKDYIVKPIDSTRVVSAVKSAIDFSEMQHEAHLLKKSVLQGVVQRPEVFERIITADTAMINIFQYVEAIAPGSLPVLITGPTGVGKELLARSIHDASGLKGKFIPVNIAGLDSHLFSDTLFGHVKGGFTGADAVRKGLIESAANGTIFLDEIGDLPHEGQVKLLRLIQEHRYYPVGSDIAQSTNVRIITATNKNLKQMQRENLFRPDLYYRLMAHEIALPPLSQRKDDIAILTDYFIEKAAKEFNKPAPSYPRELFTLLKNYSFPGNIRELQAIVFDAVGRHSSGMLSLETFKQKTGFSDTAPEKEPDCYEDAASIYNELETLPPLKLAEKQLVDEALKRAEGNVTLAAKLLGITRQALSNRLNRNK